MRNSLMNIGLSIAITIAAPVVFLGCEDMPSIGSDERKDDVNRTANVMVHDPELDEDIAVKVESTGSAGEPLFDAVKHMQVGEFTTAQLLLEKAIADPGFEKASKDRRYKTHFALAVAHEKQGNHKAAVEQYKKAVFASTTTDALNGQKRCEAQM